MPRAPITTRTMLWERRSDSTVYLLDWSLVTTSLGTMVESRSVIRGPDGIKDEDLVDSGYSAMQLLSAEDLYAQYNVGGAQWPHYRANDPGVL